MYIRPLALLLLVASGLGAPARAHEFWIDPQNYQVETGAPLVADLRNGQKFNGISLGYFERNIVRFDLIQDGTLRPVTGRMGDVPALAATAEGDGLLVIVHQTAPSTISYKTWEKFQAFADHKDFPDIRARHDARGLPEAGFQEVYSRYVKALVAVGSGAGADQDSGMETEFVALTNPYTDGSGAMRARLLYQGAPRGDAQVEVFDRDPDETVKITLYRTDNAGEVTVPVQPGHEYLFDAVVLRPTEAGSKAVWETLWAALTFAVP